MAQQRNSSSFFLHADLGHVRVLGPDAASHAAEAQEPEDHAGGQGCEQEPHEGGAGLDLAAALDSVGAAETDPTGAPSGVAAAAVDGPQLGGQDDGADEREEQGQAVEGEHGQGDGDGVDEGGDQAVNQGDPRQGCDKHGEVDGGHVAVVVGGDDVSDQGRNQEGPEELNRPDDGLHDLHGGGGGNMFARLL